MTSVELSCHSLPPTLNSLESPDVCSSVQHHALRHLKWAQLASPICYEVAPFFIASFFPQFCDFARSAVTYGITSGRFLIAVARGEQRNHL